VKEEDSDSHKSLHSYPSLSVNKEDNDPETAPPRSNFAITVHDDIDINNSTSLPALAGCNLSEDSPASPPQHTVPAFTLGQKGGNTAKCIALQLAGAVADGCCTALGMGLGLAAVATVLALAPPVMMYNGGKRVLQIFADLRGGCEQVVRGVASKAFDCSTAHSCKEELVVRSGMVIEGMSSSDDRGEVKDCLGCTAEVEPCAWIVAGMAGESSGVKQEQAGVIHLAREKGHDGIAFELSNASVASAPAVNLHCTDKQMMSLSQSG
jgi:hypothetical protein